MHRVVDYACPVCTRLRSAGKSLPGCAQANRAPQSRPRPGFVRPPCFDGGARHSSMPASWPSSAAISPSPSWRRCLRIRGPPQVRHPHRSPKLRHRGRGRRRGLALDGPRQRRQHAFRSARRCRRVALGAPRRVRHAGCPVAMPSLRRSAAIPAMDRRAGDVESFDPRPAHRR